LKSTTPLIRKILKILFVYDEEARLNLFETFPRLRSFFANRRHFALIRSFGDLAFTLLIIAGLFGPQEPERNAMLFVSWGIWWTGIVLSWFFVGRMWCGFCPFPGVGRLLQRLGLYRPKLPPRSISKYCAYAATALFALIVWAEAVFHMKHSPLATAFLLLTILFGATLLATLYKGQAWCRHFCPLGKIIGSAATLSILEFRADLEKCRGCQTFACKRGKGNIPGCPVYLGAYAARNNLICLVCGHCIPLCDRDSPGLFLRHPLKELVINKGRHLTCTYIIPFLLASQIARFIQEKTSWYQGFKSALFHSEALAFSFLLAFLFALALFVIRLGAELFTIYEDELFGRFSPMVPVLVPLAFTGELVYRLEYLLHEIGNFGPTLGKQLGLSSLEALSFRVPEAFIHYLLLGITALGLLGALYTAHLLAFREFEGLVPRKNFFAILALASLVSAVYFYFVRIY